MPQTRSRLASVRSAVLAGVLLVLAAAAGGCQSSRLGSELPHSPRPAALRPASGEPLKLPGDGGFSIAQSRSERQPGPDGEAQADAQADSSGAARATASVKEGGTATGTFQVGHAFRNDSDVQAELELAVQFRYDFEATAAPESAYPDARVNLGLYARDARGRLVRDLTLVEHSTGGGPAARNAEDTTRVTIPLAPGESVNVFLGGHVKIDIRAGRSAQARLEVANLRMDVTYRPAPAVRTATHESR